MNITVYLPDEVGERAKAAELPLSRLLRDAVISELDRRTAMTRTLVLSETHELDLQDGEGRAYTGRITGAMLALESDKHHHAEVYLTDDERVILYDMHKRSYSVLDDPVEQLRDALSLATYSGVLRDLGETPVIDL
jgi:hypothetical protein